MSDTSHPTTKAGQALAGWNSRSQSMAETIVRIEREAVANWLASEETKKRLADALHRQSEGTKAGAEFDVRAILEELRRNDA